MKNSDPGPFTSEDILYASEIGFVVDDVSATALKLKKDLALSPYPLGTDHLWAMGDEHGLLLVLKEGLLWGANTDSPKKFDVFPTVVGICGVKPTKYVIPDYPYEIIVEQGKARDSFCKEYRCLPPEPCVHISAYTALQSDTLSLH